MPAPFSTAEAAAAAVVFMAAATTSTALASSAVVSSTTVISNIRRPHASSWARTPCGHPVAAVPAGLYEPNIDYPGGDIEPCGPNGCVLAKTATHLDCETKCKQTNGCLAYVFANASCSGKTGPLCWTKGTIGDKVKNAYCRNSRVIGSTPGPGAQADIPSRWASEVNASSTPLVAYPRPQMLRGNSNDRDTGDPSTWTNLNGLWEFERTDPATPPPFGTTLNDSILVPFPVESCLSGVAPRSSAEIVTDMYYRLQFDVKAIGSGKTLLHFGAIDWQSAVYVNGQHVGNHTGGYDGFDFDVTSVLKAGTNELIVYAHDPSEAGAQPNGKQRSSAIDSPGGDTYTPTSGIWQTVWLESVPATFIQDMEIDQASTETVSVTVNLAGGAEGNALAAETIKLEVIGDDGKTVIASKDDCSPSTACALTVPDPKLWSPTSPHLYDLRATVNGEGGDAVLSYFGLRTFVRGIDANNVTRPLLNGAFTFLAGFLDQSFWPDGQYTAPTDDALAYDVQAVPMFGLNMIRLHQKVNPERWYYHADKIGVVVFQDMIQKYGGASDETIPLFVADLKAMIKGRKNHPCIVQFTTFNEGDCFSVFTKPPYDVPGIVALAQQLAPTHLVDTDSGGPANNLHIGDVNDIHSYPQPGDPHPNATQYAMVGEFGGIGAFVQGKEWKPEACHTYLKVDTPEEEASTYIAMAAMLMSNADHISASVYTQTTDVELECDGFLNYDRSNKFDAQDTARIAAINKALTEFGN